MTDYTGGRTAVALATAVLSTRKDDGSIDFSKSIDLLRPILDDLSLKEAKSALAASSALLALVLDANHGPDAYQVLELAGRTWA